MAVTRTSKSQPKLKIRPNDRGGTVPEGWEERFFAALEKTYLPTEAAKFAGVSRAHVYKVKARDPEFAERWTDIIERSTEVLEQVAVKRAVEGSDTMLIFLLKARRPSQYRENIKHDHQHNLQGQINLTLPDGQQPIQLDGASRREAALLLLQEAAQESIIDGEVVEDETGT